MDSRIAAAKSVLVGVAIGLFVSLIVVGLSGCYNGDNWDSCWVPASPQPVLVLECEDGISVHTTIDAVLLAVDEDGFVIAELNLAPGDYNIVHLACSGEYVYVLEPFDERTGVDAVECGPVLVGDLLSEECVINKPEKVEVCHKGKTVRVSEHAVQAHLAHGDTMGPCEVEPPVEPPTPCEDGGFIDLGDQDARLPFNWVDRS